MNIEKLASITGFISASITILIAIYKAIKLMQHINNRSAIERQLEGEWYSYNVTLSPTGNKFHTGYKHIIKYSWIANKYFGSSTSLTNPEVKYKLKVIIKGDNLYFICDGIHDNEMVMEIYRPIFPFTETLKFDGMGMGISYNDSLMASKSVLQKSKPDLAKLGKSKVIDDVFEVKRRK